jgi:uncharacterized membrane protein YphA (DoxX/SURF4 family)
VHARAALRRIERRASDGLDLTESDGLSSLRCASDLLAYLVCFFEFLVGLVLGLLTRLGALAVAVVMVGAIATVHARNGFFVNWELKPGKGHGFEANLAFLPWRWPCLIGGRGELAIDALLVR